MNSCTNRYISKPARTMQAAALTVALTLSSALASAQEAEYITGGVGAEQREEMKAQRDQYNLLLTFADRNGEMQAGVAVTVRDRRGRTVLELPDAGPMVYAKLPPGSYRIIANVDGRQQVRSANVGHGPREVSFHWAAEMASAR
ncbi:hypothetical protein ASD15_09625 [Massilia sp. Root351]|jgi:plasmid stabilization system protein ParE|uniref:hypothetical protein n=1 Tax=Massilia sp. Root351 TaxID=1736522 RepID=UPI0007103208|nr:hypothetical protein [Massilia sp. Root351]KQV82297.1 hypothetical protein ASD15_09625 [Massilia sp. Root351]